jgi:hypothetical protein
MTGIAAAGLTGTDEASTAEPGLGTGHRRWRGNAVWAASHSRPLLRIACIAAGGGVSVPLASIILMTASLRMKRGHGESRAASKHAGAAKS